MKTNLNSNYLDFKYKIKEQTVEWPVLFGIILLARKVKLNFS